MTYISGQPIVFVGTGQTYPDLKSLDAKVYTKITNNKLSSQIIDFTGCCCCSDEMNASTFSSEYFNTIFKLLKKYLYFLC